MAPIRPASLPGFAAAVLAVGGADLLQIKARAKDVLDEMIASSNSREHAQAIYAFNVARTAQDQREAVASFYGYESAAAAEAALRGMDRASIPTSSRG